MLQRYTLRPLTASESPYYTSITKRATTSSSQIDRVRDGPHAGALDVRCISQCHFRLKFPTCASLRIGASSYLQTHADRCKEQQSETMPVHAWEARNERHPISQHPNPASRHLPTLHAGIVHGKRNNISSLRRALRTPDAHITFLGLCSTSPGFDQASSGDLISAVHDARHRC